jgi:hypothetical protein
MRKTAAILAALSIASTPAWAQKISAFPNLPGAAAALSDALVTQSANCAAGNCRTTVQQIIGAVLANPNTWTVPQLFQGQSNTAFTADTGMLIGQLNAPANTAAVIYHDLCPGCNPNADAVRGVATATSGSTVTNVNGIAAYVLNQNPSANNGANSVGLFSTVISAVDGAESWGINTNLTDNINGFAVSSGQRRQLLNELDFNVTSINTAVNGLILQGASVQQPYSANGFVVGGLHLQSDAYKWGNAFLSEPGAATVALDVGLAHWDVQSDGSHSIAGQVSQLLAFDTTDNTKKIQSHFIYGSGDPLGLVFLTPAILPRDNDAMSIGSPNKHILQVFSKSVVLEVGTASQLPGCNYYSHGGIAFVTDAQSTTSYQYVQGGGAYNVLVACDGSGWVVH